MTGKEFETIQVDEVLKEKVKLQAAQMRAEVSTVKPRKHRRWQMALAALMVAVVLSGSFGYHTITAEAAYVSVEASGAENEPGLGLSVNRWGTVIGAEGWNEEGKTVLAQVKLVGLPYKEALEKVLTAAEALGYLKDEMHVDFSVCAGAEDSLVQLLQQESQSVVERVCPYTSCGYGWMSNTARQNAGQYGMSCNRYQLAEEIMKLDNKVTIEDCSVYTMQQLRCWYWALCEGKQVDVEDVADLCKEYGCGAGPGKGNGYGGNYGQGYRGGRGQSW